MKVMHATTVLAVNDLERSICFYVGQLGFEQEFRFEHYIGLRNGGCRIGLSGPGDPRHRQPGTGEVYVSCDEVDAYYHSLAADGVVFDEPLHDREYGVRDFSLRDPDGNVLAFGTATAAKSDLGSD